MKSLEYASNEYNVSIRTISRRIKEIQKSNPELIALYREHANYLKTGAEIPTEIQRKIDQIERRPVILSTITQNREDELRETIRKFEELLSKGMSKAQTAKTLGYPDHTPIWKKYEELKRIETEKRAQAGAANSKRSIFIDSLKANTGGADNAHAVNGEGGVQTVAQITIADAKGVGIGD